jgi:hypothetical protein
MTDLFYSLLLFAGLLTVSMADDRTTRRRLRRLRERLGLR